MKEFRPVYKSGKWNFIDENYVYLCKEWLDEVTLFSDGIARVKEKGKYNYIDSHGMLISDRWFDRATEKRDETGAFDVSIGRRLFKMDKFGALLEYTKV